MTRRFWIIPTVVLAVILGALAFRISEAKGEVTALPGAGAIPAQAGERQLKLVPSKTLQLECWQQGVKIIDESEVGGISVRSLLDQDTVSFGGGFIDQPTFILLSLQDATCLVRARE